MVLFVELLLAVGVLVGVYLLATGRTPPMAAVEPDLAPGDLAQGPLTAVELATVRLPLGVGYRKVDVDRLLDRVGRQLWAEADPTDAYRGHPHG